MIVKNIRDEDFTNYKKVSMIIGMPKCSFKCDKECGLNVCQNSALAQAKDIEIDIEQLVKRYLDNPISEAIVFGGLEPFDSWSDLLMCINLFRKQTNDDIIIYTGYTEDEIRKQVNSLKQYPNIIIKYGRFIPNTESIYDDILGINLSSNNQYSRRIS